MKEPLAVYQGSVKKILADVMPTETRFGRARMLFDSNGFSLFDYGTFPFGIPGKGYDLYEETGRFGQVLKEAGIPTHIVSTAPGLAYRIVLARMLGYDEIIAGDTIIYRVPVECVYSHAMTPVSSLHKRLRSGRADPADYGLERVPEAGETVILPEIGTSFSTKIETRDSYKTLRDMARLAGLTEEEERRLNAITIAGAQALIDDAAEVGLLLADGKFEFLMGPGRNLIVGDTGYTWDENRILRQLPDGHWVDLSKQLARNVYTINGWRADLERAQEQYPDDKSMWPAPTEVGEDVRAILQDACRAVRYTITRKTKGPDIDEVARRAQDTLDRLKEQYHRDELGNEI